MSANARRSERSETAAPRPFVDFPLARLQSRRSPADNWATMRTLGFRTHVLLSMAAAAVVVLTLSRPWYAEAPRALPDEPGIGDINGPLNGLVDGAQRWVTGPDGLSGWDSLGTTAYGLAAVAALAALGALLCLVPALQTIGRDLLRYGALATVGVAAWKLLDPPGDNAILELRHGALVAFAAALMLLACGMATAAAPSRRRLVPQNFSATVPAPPPSYSTSGSAPPPGV